ncbi:VanW family protein [Candidatus Peregrinibacteria bacterium]|nr:VanW family protein [Candidatus Peregrinibacteria bacterium]
MKAIFGLAVSIVSIILLSSAALALDLFKRRDLVIPRTVLGDLALGGMTRDEARETIRQKLQTFLEQPFSLGARGEVQSVMLKDFGIQVNESILLQNIPFANNISNLELIVWSVAGQRVAPNIPIEKPELLRVIEEKFPNIPKARNAYFELNGKKIKIREAEVGVTPNLEPFIHQIRQQITFLEHQPLVVDFRESKPDVSAADLQAHEVEIQKSFPKKLTLLFEKQKWEANFEKHPEWIVLDRKPYKVAEGQLPFSLQWEPVAFSRFLQNTASELEQAPENVRIFRDENGSIQFDGRAVDGRAIERERLLTLANLAIAEQKEEIEIPLKVVFPKVEVAQDLNELGISELIGVGHTKFEGSPKNRKHNIGVGIAKFNGLIVPQGSTFSFNDNLGPVDGSTGYRKELVIKPEGTIPEFGGGLCQVSSTMFRAIMYTGLPVVERWPHSYAVTYYAQVGGHGLDATIYPPSRDLKFLNDTPGSIVIQSYVDGDHAYFKFYGTNDGRKVVMEGPTISNKRSAPAEALLVPDKDLAPGEKKQVEKPHGGFDSLWYRYVTKNGETAKEEIYSRYKAVPAKYLVGGEVSAEGENKGLTENTNPFE